MNPHYPGRAPIDAYGNGGFRFAGMSHQGSLLVLPSGMYRWDVGDLAMLKPGDFDLVFPVLGLYENSISHKKTSSKGLV